jgi:hypothetical protein
MPELAPVTTATLEWASGIAVIGVDFSQQRRARCGHGGVDM